MAEALQKLGVDLGGDLRETTSVLLQTYIAETVQDNKFTED